MSNKREKTIKEYRNEVIDAIDRSIDTEKSVASRNAIKYVRSVRNKSTDSSGSLRRAEEALAKTSNLETLRSTITRISEYTDKDEND